MTTPDRDHIDLSDVLAALADPNRRKVVTELLAEPDGTERTCVSFDVPWSKSSRTFHFRTLREAGLTVDTDYGNRKGVILRRADIESRFPGLFEAITQADE